MTTISKAQPKRFRFQDKDRLALQNEFDAWSRQVSEHRPIPLVPSRRGGFSRRHLIFHCYPRLGTDWQAVCWSTFRFREVFNGQIVVSVTTGHGCADPRTVADWFRQFDLPDELQFVENDSSAGINTTFRDQLRTIRNETGIVFKSHTKGISHIANGTDPFGQWRDNMTAGCLGDIAHVTQKFCEGYKTFGVYKTFSPEGACVMGQISGPLRTQWPGWHYPGAVFWFAPRDIPDQFFNLPQNHYENEAFPCHIGPSETAYSVKHDNLIFVSADVQPYFAELNRPLRLSELQSAAANGRLVEGVR